MEWRSVQFDWNRARAFLVTAEEGSLSAAARALGLTQPTLGRQVAALERELGVALFDRLGRGFTLTPSGLELVEHVRAMGEAANRVSLTASGQAEAVEGLVRITATEAYAAHILPPIIASLREAAPGVQVDLIASNDVSDLRRREADIAVRSAEPKDAELIGKRVRMDQAYLYGAHAYLDARPAPTSYKDFSDALFLGFDRNEGFLTALNKMGFALTTKNFPVLTGSHLVQWQLVKEGLGLGFMPSRIGDEEPAVRRAFPDMAALDVPIWLVAHREVNTSRRVRLVFDHLSDALQE